MRTILIVDDEFGIVDALGDLLTDEGYRVVSAANGRAGLALIAKASPDLVLLDLMMPVMNGIEMLRNLRASTSTRSLPVVLMSAAPKFAALAMEPEIKEFSDYLRKPFDLDDVLDIVKRLIGPGE